MELIRNYIEPFIKLADDEWQTFQSKLVYTQYEKGEVFLREGSICRHAIFVEDGGFRFYKTVDGIDRVTAFFFTGDFLSDYQSFLTEKPSQYSIEALRDSKVYRISRGGFEELYHESKSFERLGRLFAERLFLAMNARLDSFLYETPESRYDALVRRNSKLLQDVPQYMIASYLGVTPETLSRIRKRML